MTKRVTEASDSLLIWMGLVSGLTLGMVEVVICHDLFHLLAPGDTYIGMPWFSIPTAIIFDMVVGGAIACTLYCPVKLHLLSLKTATQFLSALLLTVIPWIYGLGSIAWRINTFSSARLTAISIWTLLCVVAAVLLVYGFRKIFRDGLKLPIHACMGALVYFTMLTGTRGMRGGLSVRSLVKTFHFTDLLSIGLLLVTVYVFARAWPSRRFRFGLIASLVVGAILIASRLASTMNGNGILTKGADAEEVSEQTRARPNVVLVVLDTLRADHLGAYGYSRNTSPNLDRFASVSDFYRRCYSTSSWTLPSHASLFTGQFPRTHGAHYDLRASGRARPLPPEAVTLAEVLQDSGYSTGAICANQSYLTPFFKLDQGFSFYLSKWHTQSKVPTLSEVTLRYLSGVFSSSDVFGWLRDVVRPTMLPYPSGDVTVKIALEWLDQQGEQPFFLFVNLMDVHTPHIPRSRFDRTMNGRMTQIVHSGHIKDALRPGAEHESIPEAFQQELTAAYDAEIAFVDAQLGFFLNGLKERGLYDNSLVIVTSDHGDHLFEHDLVGHGDALYQETSHVPLIVHTPEQDRGRVFDHIVQLVNIMPSVCEAVGVAIPKTAEFGTLSSPNQINAAELYKQYPEEQTSEWNSRDVLALWQSEHKYIEDSRGVRELFDLKADPGEQNNLVSGDEHPLVRQYEDLSGQFHDRIHKYEAGDSTTLPTIDDDTNDRLEALGYL